MSIDQLEGTKENQLGSKQLKNHYSDWRDNIRFSEKGIPIDINDSDYITDNVLKELSIDKDIVFNIKKSEEKQKTKEILENSVVNQWAYYPCLATIKVIDATLKKWLSDLSTILGFEVKLNNDFPAPDKIKALVWVKKLVNKRIENIKNIARKNAKNKKSLRLVRTENSEIESFKVIWDDEQYSAKEKKQKLLSKTAGKADLQVIECVLMSKGEVGWVRGPAWYLPKDKTDLKLSKGHLHEITEKIAVVSNATKAKTLENYQQLEGTNLKKALKQITSEFKDSATKGKFIFAPMNFVEKTTILESQFWSTSYHWAEGLGPDGETPKFKVDASTQFLRFTSKARNELNMPLSSHSGLSANTEIEKGGKLHFDFDLLRGQIGVSVWYPLSKNNSDKKPMDKFQGQKLNIQYIAKHKAEPQLYRAGELFMRLSATVYGFAGASINIAGNINFGMAANDEGSIGIKGKALTLTDYNENEVTQKRVVDTQALPKPYKNVEKVAADSGVTVDIFAGVEGGGIGSCSVHWRTPEVKYDGVVLKTEFLELGTISGQVAVSAGYGISGVFRITFHMGTLYLIAKAKLVCGPGASGQVAIKLNYGNVDRFIQCLLGVLNESGFVKIDALGTIGVDGRSDDFELLNAYLTMSVVFGLTLGEALLIPFTFMDEVKKNGLQSDYAPMLAKNILNDSNLRSNQIWINQLPPETLSNLVLSLCSYRGRGKEQHIKTNMQSFKAIIQILEWIDNRNNNSDLNERKFELTLMNMVGNMESAKNPKVKWDRFYRGWCILIGYVGRLNLDVKDSKDLALINDINNDIKSFNRLIKKLCFGYARFHFEPKFGYGKNYDIVYKMEKEGDSKIVIKSRNEITSELCRKDESGSWLNVGWTL